MFTKRTAAEDYKVETSERQEKIAQELQKVGKVSLTETTPRERAEVLRNSHE